MTASALAYIGVGSNIEPEQNVVAALEHIVKQLEITDISTFYQSPALGRSDQADYRNGVLQVRTVKEPQSLKVEILREIERRMGRRRTDDKFAARVIDLDLLLYDNRVIHEDEIELPNPDIRSRPFVAIPLLELAPEIILPDTNTYLRDVPVAHLADSLKPDFSLTKTIKERFLDEQRTY